KPVIKATCSPVVCFSRGICLLFLPAECQCIAGIRIPKQITCSGFRGGLFPGCHPPFRLHNMTHHAYISDQRIHQLPLDEKSIRCETSVCTSLGPCERRSDLPQTLIAEVESPKQFLTAYSQLLILFFDDSDFSTPSSSTFNVSAKDCGLNFRNSD